MPLSKKLSLHLVASGFLVASPVAGLQHLLHDLRSTQKPTSFLYAPSRRIASQATSRRRDSSVEDLVDMELQALASAQSKLDQNRLLQALDPVKRDAFLPATSSAWGVPQTWKLALAATALCAVSTFLVCHSVAITVATSVVVFVAASADPLDDDSLLGAVARILGRATLQSVQATEPKVKAIARAVVMGEEELLALRQQVQMLRDENSELRHWKDTRLKMEDSLSSFALADLKDLSRRNNLPIGGTKLQLLSRLVEAGLVDL